MTNKPEVTQVDRDAAWPFRPSCYHTLDRPAWNAGRYDDCTIVQAFARHRIAAEEAGAIRARYLALIVGGE